MVSYTGPRLYQIRESQLIFLHRVELQGSFMFDVPPIFPIPKQWNRSVEILQISDRSVALLDSLQHAWASVFMGTDWEWFFIFEDMIRFSYEDFATSSESVSPAMSTSSVGSGAWTNSIIHRLLSFRPRENVLSSRSFQTQEACRLGSLLFMVPVWRFFGVGPLAPGTLLTNLRHIIEVSNAEWGQMSILRLWILYVGTVEALGGPLEAWFLEHLVGMCMASGIKSWGEGIKAVKNVLWFSCLFESKDVLLEEIMRLRLENCP